MNDVVRLIISVVAPQLVGLTSAFLTMGGVRTWYPGLAKPPFNPPAWVFGPVWTALYLLMGIACFLVWRQGLSQQAVRIALVTYVVQLLLNGLWSLLFFGLEWPLGALAEIVALLACISVTIVLFGRVSRPAAWLLVPYWAWVAFASVLNFELWRLNRPG